MNGLWLIIGKQVWKYLEPYLESKWAEVEPKLEGWVKEKFDEWLPKILKTIVVGISQSAGQLVVNTEDKVTDIIPGDLDDKVLDPIVKNALDFLNKTFGIKV